MSRIYFVTPDREVEVRGTERAYMGVLTSDLALAVLRLRKDDLEWVRSITIASYDLFQRPDWWVTDWETSFKVSMSSMRLRIGGEEVDTMDAALNTVIAMGSPVLTLLAKLHGTCEDHGWVDAEDAGWFAEIVEQGRRDNVLRPGVGWEAVAELAREVESGTPGPIVTSYSVTDGFPNSYVAGWEPPTDEEGEQDWDAWYSLSDDERWRRAEAGMRGRKHNRQIAPHTMDGGFSSGRSLFDLQAERWEGAIA